MSSDTPQLRCWTCGGWFTPPRMGNGLWGGIWFFPGERTTRPGCQFEDDDDGEAGAWMSASRCRPCARRILGLPDTPAPRVERNADLEPLPRTTRRRRQRQTKGEGF